MLGVVVVGMGEDMYREAMVVGWGEEELEVGALLVIWGGEGGRLDTGLTRATLIKQELKEMG
jgi:thiamine pyrophosphokinase